MSRLIKIKAYEYAELNDKAKNNFINEMLNMPFEYEDEDKQGNTIIKYDYFGEWDLNDQIEHCETHYISPYLNEILVLVSLVLMALYPLQMICSTQAV